MNRWKRLMHPPEQPWEGAPTLGILAVLVVVLYVAIYLNTYSGLYN